METLIGCWGLHAPSTAQAKPGRPHPRGSGSAPLPALAAPGPLTPLGGYRGRRAGEAGISLVEVVLAAAVLAVAMLLVSASVTTALRANAFARERGIATAAAEAKLEELIAHPLQPVIALPGLLLFNGTTFVVDGLSGSGGARAGSIRIDATGIPLVTVEVTVAWVGSFGADRISLKTTVLTVSTGL